MKRAWWAAVALGVPAAVASVVSFASLATAELEARAEAAIPTVVLLRPSQANDVTTEALVRVQGELEAAGFEVDVLRTDAHGDGEDAKRDLETAGRERNPVAAFAIFVSPPEGGASIAEIWVSDRVRQKTVIQRTTLHETDGARGSAILAVRAVELLKASLADLWTAATQPPPAPAPVARPVPVPVAREQADTPRRAFAAGLGAGVGVGLVESFGAMGVTWAPDFLLSYGWPGGFGVRASLLGPGPATTLSALQGTARIEQQLATVDVVKTWWPRAPVVPFVLLGVGAQHVHVTGAGLAPYLGHTTDDWSAVTAAGVGIGIPVVSTLSFIVHARGVAAWPASIVRIADAEVGRVGAPSLLVDGELLGVLP
jgi:hypothetical protein